MFDTIVTIIDRYATDREFRHEVQAQPDVALAGYHLSSEEHAALSNALGTQTFAIRSEYAW